jgi:hypothetical protein
MPVGTFLAAAGGALFAGAGAGAAGFAGAGAGAAGFTGAAAFGAGFGSGAGAAFFAATGALLAGFDSAAFLVGLASAFLADAFVTVFDAGADAVFLAAAVFALDEEALLVEPFFSADEGFCVFFAIVLYRRLKFLDRPIIPP